MSAPVPMAPEGVKRQLASIDSKLRTALGAPGSNQWTSSQDYAEAYGGARYIAQCAALYSEAETLARFEAEAADLEAQAQAWYLTPEGRTVLNWAALAGTETADQYTAGEGNDHVGVPR